MTKAWEQTSLVTIGARTRLDTSLVGQLGACHRRIREHLALAHRLCVETGHSEPDIRDTARRVRRYFSIALPLHVADEDDIIVPGLGAANPILAVALTVIAEQHDNFMPLVDWLVELCTRLELHPDVLGATQPLLAQTLELLGPQMAYHLELEEQMLFPAIARLPASVQADMVNAMRARRMRT